MRLYSSPSTSSNRKSVATAVRAVAHAGQRFPLETKKRSATSNNGAGLQFSASIGFLRSTPRRRQPGAGFRHIEVNRQIGRSCDSRAAVLIDDKAPVCRRNCLVIGKDRSQQHAACQKMYRSRAKWRRSKRSSSSGVTSFRAASQAAADSSSIGSAHRRCTSVTGVIPGMALPGKM